MGGVTLLILVALAFSTPGGSGELVKAALPGSPVQRLALPELERAQAEVVQRQVRRQTREQDFRGVLALGLVTGGAMRASEPAHAFAEPGQSPRRLRASILSLPPPRA